MPSTSPPEPPTIPRSATHGSGARRRGALATLRGCAAAALPLSRTARRETVYSVVAPLPAFICGIVLLALLAAALVASVTQVGLILLVGVLTVARGTGALHRLLLRRLLGEHVPAPPPRTREGRGLVATVRSALTDSDGWRAAAMTVAYAPLGVVLLVVSVGVRLYGLAGVSYPLWWRAIEEDGRRGIGLPGGVPLDSWPRALLTALAGLLVLAFATWSVRGLLDLVLRPMARALLGPGRLADRVHVLEETRALAVQDAAATLRRIERDLHDGAQARLIAVGMALAGAQDQLARAPGEAPELVRGRRLVDDALDNSMAATKELRSLIRGIHPPALNSGLDVALETLAGRAGLPVTARIDLPSRPPEAIESIAYFCAAELLANASRHAHADHADLTVRMTDRQLLLTVHDNGRGGAHAQSGAGSGGSGLAGLVERVSTVDGRLLIDSPVGGPTTVTVELPLLQAAGSGREHQEHR